MWRSIQRGRSDRTATSVAWLKLYDPRVTESSLTKFCARYGALIKTDFLDKETRDWLAGPMDLAPSAGRMS